MTTKQFLCWVGGLYVVCAVIGVGLFKSPNYSRAYMAEFREDHERYHKIIKKEVYKEYIERPKLHPADAQLLADAAYAKEYEARPRFQAERRRMFVYGMYFKVLNSAAFIALLGRALKKPVADFLDGRIAEIRGELDNTAQARAEAEKTKAAAAARMEQWARTVADMQKETDSLVARNVADIHKEFEEGQAQLIKETADRKQSEAYRAARTLKEELVAQAIGALEERYKTQTTQEALAGNVEKFMRLMERLS